MKTIEYFKNRYQQLIPNFHQFIDSLNHSPQSLLRPNLLKINSNNLDKIFYQHYGKEILKKSDFRLENYFSLDPEFSLGGSLEHLLGYFYVQGYSSQLAVEVLDPRPEESVLDLCAAPGGKTVLIAQQMKNTGFLLANELYINRNIPLKSNIDRCGVRNCMITNQNGERLLAGESFFFDRVLLDGPCSSEGTLMFDKNEELPFKKDKEFRNSLMVTQKKLIQKAYNLLKPSGVLVYSTCTYAPEENEQIVDFLLKNNLDADILEIKNVEDFVEGITHWNDNEFDSRLVKTKRVYPHRINSWGFYVAKIIKRS